MSTFWKRKVQKVAFSPYIYKENYIASLHKESSSSLLPQKKFLFLSPFIVYLHKLCLDSDSVQFIHIYPKQKITEETHNCWQRQWRPKLLTKLIPAAFSYLIFLFFFLVTFNFHFHLLPIFFPFNSFSFTILPQS